VKKKWLEPTQAGEGEKSVSAPTVETTHLKGGCQKSLAKRSSEKPGKRVNDLHLIRHGFGQNAVPQQLGGRRSALSGENRKVRCRRESSTHFRQQKSLPSLQVPRWDGKRIKEHQQGKAQG